MLEALEHQDKLKVEELGKILERKSVLPLVRKMIEKGIEPGYASKLIQYGWETITEALKHEEPSHFIWFRHPCLQPAPWAEISTTEIFL